MIAPIAGSVLWRRLDTPGHDACRLVARESGWELVGTAVFQHEGKPASLAYRLVCDGAWHTHTASVSGFVGDAAVDVVVARTAAGIWTFDGQAVDGFEQCAHLDFGFTPATNLSQLRDLSLSPGQGAEIPVVWIDVPPSHPRVLPQRYERRGELTYWYESPTTGYAAQLELTPSGFVRLYPQLWELE